jgi:hypothetical protein
MNLTRISLIVLSSIGLMYLSACNGGNPVTKSEDKAGSSSPVSKDEATAKNGEKKAKDGEKHSAGDGHTDHAKDGEKHTEGDGHTDHAKDGEKKDKDSHTGQVVKVGKYHVEFKPDLEKDSIHLDTVLHGEQDKQITDAKLIAQVQLPDGSSKTLPVAYNTEEKQYTAQLPVGGAGDYKVVFQVDVGGEKFNSRFSFKR